MRRFMRFTREVCVRLMGDYEYMIHVHGESKEDTLNPTRCMRSNFLMWSSTREPTTDNMARASKLLAQQNDTENVLLYSDLLDAMHCRLRIRSKVRT